MLHLNILHRTVCVGVHVLSSIESMWKGTRKPIGLFDSGLGGLRVLQHLYQAVPWKDFIYFADLRHMPYGNRSSESVLELSQKNVNILQSYGCNLVIAACHTSTTCLKAEKVVPSPHFLSMAESVYTSVHQCVQERCIDEIVILGTERTVQSCVYQDALRTMFPGVRCSAVACPSWVPAIEAEDEEAKQAAVLEMLPHFYNAKAIVYGCTHFSDMERLLQTYLSKTCVLLDPAIVLAETLKASMECSKELRSGSIHIITNVQKAPQLERSAQMFCFGRGVTTIEYVIDPLDSHFLHHKI